MSWPDPRALSRVTTELARCPPLVSARECEQLKSSLAAVARGEAILLQGGDCAETFDGVGAEAVCGKLTTLLQMAVVLSYAASVPVIPVGRIAGQYAKPRSRPTQTQGGRTLPAYRGDAINGREFDASSRRPNPARLLRAYQASAATLNLIRTYVTSRQGNLDQLQARNRDFVAGSPWGDRQSVLTDAIDRALHFMRSCGADPARLQPPTIYVSHEGLSLDYEAALTRADSETGRCYGTSGHLLWIGDRTRGLGEAHVEFFSRISNPIAVKLGPTAMADDALALIDKLNPEHEPGRLTFIVRLGAARIRDQLPGLVEKVTASGAQVAWACDPMHGNTITAPSGRKTRRFGDMIDELAGFFDVHRQLGTYPGGLHLELSGDDVTECTGGGNAIGLDSLQLRYESACDPRLNRSQCLDLAFLVAEMYGAR